MSLRLSSKHGVNPSLGMCFWCGESKEVILFGHLPGDREAPKQVTLDYDPCKKCTEQFQQGILFFEATEQAQHENQRSLSGAEGKEVYPTGTFVVIRREVVDGMFTPEVAKNILKAGKSAVPAGVFQQLFGGALELVEAKAD